MASFCSITAFWKTAPRPQWHATEGPGAKGLISLSQTRVKQRLLRQAHFFSPDFPPEAELTVMRSQFQMHNMLFAHTGRHSLSSTHHPAVTACVHVCTGNF